MKNILKISMLTLGISIAAISCEKQTSDAELSSQATTAIAEFPGTSVKVIDGQAHLSGDFASESEKQTAIDAIKKIQGVKDIHDMASVNAVTN